MKRHSTRFGKADLPRFGRQIRELRMASGRTQAEVASLAGLAESTVSAVETGRSNPSLPTIVSLAGALGVSIDQLVTEATRPQGRVAVTRASAHSGSLSASLANPALQARSIRLPQGAQERLAPDGSAGAAVMVMMLEGIALATTATGDRLRLETGDTCHARDGALLAVAGLGDQTAHLLCVTDARRRPQTE